MMVWHTWCSLLFTITHKNLRRTNSSEDVLKLREHSRQQYLIKREEKEVKLLEKSIQDDEYLFEGIQLSKNEEKRRDLEKKILGVAQNKDHFDFRSTG